VKNIKFSRRRRGRGTTAPPCAYIICFFERESPYFFRGCRRDPVRLLYKCGFGFGVQCSMLNREEIIEEGERG
jgi:hypothetical protein